MMENPMNRLSICARLLTEMLVLVAGLLCMPAHSTAKTAKEPVRAVDAVPKDVTQDQLNSLIAKMSDVEVRQLALERIATAAPPADGADATGAKPVKANVLDVAIDTIHLAASRTVEVVLNSGVTTSLILSILVSHAAAAGTDGILTFVGLFALVIALGALAEIGVERLLGDWRIAPVLGPDATVRQKFARNAKLFVRDIIGQIAFFIVVSIAVIELMPEQDLPVARILIVRLVIFPRFVGAFLRFVFAPKQHQLLEVNSEDWTRRLLYRHLFGMVILNGVNTALFRLIQLTGEDVPGLGFWLNLVIFVWLGVIIVVARKEIRVLVRGKLENVTAKAEWVAWAYPGYAVILVVLTWVFSMIAASAGLGAFLLAGSHLATLGVLLTIPLIDAAVRSMVVQVMRPMQGQGPVAEAAQTATRGAYIRMARVLVIAGSFAIIGRLWGFGLVDIASSGVGDRFAERIIVFIDILLVGYFCWEISRLLINRKLAEEFTASQGLPPDEDSTAIQIDKGSSRLATVLPIFSWIVQSAIIAATVLMALSNLGVDITALVAGAGIFGLAIGFGSQKLVSDIVSGMFF
jgi:hypothetical protein